MEKTTRYIVLLATILVFIGLASVSYIAALAIAIGVVLPRALRALNRRLQDLDTLITSKQKQYPYLRWAGHAITALFKLLDAVSIVLIIASLYVIISLFFDLEIEAPIRVRPLAFGPQMQSSDGVTLPPPIVDEYRLTVKPVGNLKSNTFQITEEIVLVDSTIVELQREVTSSQAGFTTGHFYQTSRIGTWKATGIGKSSFKKWSSKTNPN